METRGVRALLVAIPLALALGACGRGERVAAPVPRPSATAEPTAEPPATESPATSPPPTATPHPSRPPALMSAGSHGPWVRALQIHLARATYDPGPADGKFGDMTLHAVIAFEKVNGLPVDGIVGRAELRTIATEAVPTVEAREVPDYVEVDIGRQVLFEVRDHLVVRTLPVSTGSGDYYQSTSGVAVAHTPRGSFAITSKIAGWHVGYLGAMYYPSYFSNGYAIHGSTSVPPYPASHGCVRIPPHSTVGFYDRNPIGTPVFVHD